MNKTVLRYGLLAGAVMFGLGIIPLVLMRGKDYQYDVGEIFGYTSMALGLTAVFFGIRHYRDQQPGGAITFGRAVGVGVLITVVASLLFVVVDTLYVTVIDPNFSADYCAKELARMEAEGAPAEEVAELEKMSTMMGSPMGVAFLEVVMFFTVFFIGLAITLLSALVLKREGVRLT